MDADIVAVTVYPQQARVTRRARARLAAGDQRVVIGGIPQQIRDDSVRVSARGPVTVLGADVTHESHPRSPDPVITELQDRERSLRTEDQRLADAEGVQQSRVELLLSVARQSGKAVAKALATSAAEPDRVATLNDAIAEQLSAVYAERRQLAEQRRQLEQELLEVERLIGNRNAQTTADRRAIVVELDVNADAEVELEVSYLVTAASWQPHYDLRLVEDTLTLTWYGMVSQHSGEDWPECELRLSTARPAQSVRIPELDPWYLDRLRPPVPMAQKAAGFGAMPAGARESYADGAAEGSDYMQRAVVSTATVEHGIAAALYTPARPVAVPADGTAHRTTIAVVQLPARLDHVTVPLHSPQAYLRATVVNTTEHTLLPGQASLFHGADFVGSTRLEVWAPGEDVELALGVDDRVRVERELVGRSASKKAVGRTRRREASYRITVGNFGPRPTVVSVHDQVPISRDEAIAVRELHAKPKPADTPRIGELLWQLQLDPGATGEITFGFQVDLAGDIEVIGWRD